MNVVKNKLRSQRGETLVELLASILIAALSVGLLMGAVAISVRFNRQAREQDEAFYQGLTQAETRTEPVTEGVAGEPEIILEETLSGERIVLPVQVYGGNDLYSYALSPAEGEDP